MDYFIQTKLAEKIREFPKTKKITIGKDCVHFFYVGTNTRGKDVSVFPDDPDTGGNVLIRLHSKL